MSEIHYTYTLEFNNEKHILSVFISNEYDFGGYVFKTFSLSFDNYEIFYTNHGASIFIDKFKSYKKSMYCEFSENCYLCNNLFIIDTNIYIEIPIEFLKNFLRELYILNIGKYKLRELKINQIIKKIKNHGHL